MDHAAAPDAPEALTPALEELVRAATRLVMGSPGLAISSAGPWHRGSSVDGAAARSGIGELASAAMGLGLATERVAVRGAAADRSELERRIRGFDMPVGG